MGAIVLPRVSLLLHLSDEGKYVGVEDCDTGEMTLIPLKRIRVRPAVTIACEGDDSDIVPSTQPLTRQEQVHLILGSQMMLVGRTTTNFIYFN